MTPATPGSRNPLDPATAATSPQTEVSSLDGLDLSTSEKLDAANSALSQADGDPGKGEAPRRIVGLQCGRIVNYVMADGKIRPFMIVSPGDGTGSVNGVLFFDGINDALRHPRGLVNDASGHLPSCSVLLQAVAFDGETFNFGTWHWPTKEPVMASSMDPHAFETMLLAAVERTIADEKNALVSLVNAKLAAQLDAVNQSIDSFHSMIKGLIGGAGGTIAPPLPTEFANLNEAIAACGKDELVNIATDGKISIEKISPEDASHGISQGHVVRVGDAESAGGEQAANTATAGSSEGGTAQAGS